MIEAARAKFDYVVVDTPAALTEIVLAAFDLSDQLYVMATIDLPSVRHMGVFLNTMEKLKIPSDNVKLILNKAESDVGIDVDQITRLFPQGFTSVLPYAQEVTKSVNVGTPMLAFDPNSDVSRRMAAGMGPLLPEGMQSKVPTFTEPGTARKAQPVRPHVPPDSPIDRLLREDRETLRQARSPGGPGASGNLIPVGSDLRRTGPPAVTTRPAEHRPDRHRPPGGATSAASWHASKRKVRELVLAEVAPKATGSPPRASPTRSSRPSTTSSSGRTSRSPPGSGAPSSRR